MEEPRDLREARRRLARAEAALETEAGLLDLEEGLGLIDAVLADPAAHSQRQIAVNLGRTYAARIHERIARQLEAGRNLPEPVLRHAFAVLRSFDGASFDVPPASTLKIELVRRLIDLYYEGYSQEDKQRAYDELAEISGAASEEHHGRRR